MSRITVLIIAISPMDEPRFQGRKEVTGDE
jgi:hypothetical protein